MFIDPSQGPPELLIEAITTDKEAFLPGRRNNDIVNWYIAWRLHHLKYGTTVTTDGLIDKMDAWLGSMDPDDPRKISLVEGWDEDYWKKLRLLHQHYGSYNSQLLYGIWLMMDYEL
jgi:hypothetical protein